MSDFLYLIVLVAIPILGISWYTKWSNAKTPKSEILSDEEVRSREKEKFPIWYHLYYPIYIIVMIGFAEGLVFLSWFFVINYSQWVLSGEEYIARSTNPYGLYLILLVFIPGMIFGGLLLSPLDRILPGLVRYVEKNQLKQWGLRVKADAKSVTRQFLRFAIITSTIIFPLLFLAADNYYYVDKQALHYNSFWGFGGKTISLNNLERIEAGAWPNNGRNAVGINWEYILVFKNGEKFNLKEAGAFDLKKLDIFLKEKNIPVKITTLREGAMTWVNNRGSQDLKDLFTQVFSEGR